jgi:hypothetical protein
MAEIDVLTKIMDCAYASKSDLYRIAEAAGKPVQACLHWTAFTYDRTFPDYHINIKGNGEVEIMEEDFSVKLPHNYMKNSASIGISLCCCKDATSNDLGDYPPTEIQINTMAKIIAVLAEALDLPITKKHFPTHGESADNEDYTIYFNDWNGYPNNTYGPKSDVCRWDLELLGKNTESPVYNPYDEEHRGGTILRGKGIWYRNRFYGHNY